MQPCKPMTGEDYDIHWDYTDYKDKIVLDIGADYGSTAYWFLEKGAKEIVALEADNDMFNTLKSNKDDRVKPFHYCLTQPNDYNHWIVRSRADVVKIDIEGDERHLLGADPQIISTVKEYLIETHTAEIFCDLAAMFTRLGYEVKYCCQTSNLTVLGHKFNVDVLYARRKDESKTT